MTAGQPEGMTISHVGDQVVIDVPGGRWEGSASDVERLLTKLHYVLARARPGTSIASVLVDGQLWGGKSLELDREAAIRDMRQLVDGLARKLAELENDSDAA